MGHLGAEELRRVQRGLVDHHGHALGLHALHDALDGARAEVVGVGLHRQAADAHDGFRLNKKYLITMVPYLIRAITVINGINPFVVTVEDRPELTSVHRLHERSFDGFLPKEVER